MHVPVQSHPAVQPVIFEVLPPRDRPTHRPNRARISVHDHIPVSSDGDIKVRLRETSPDPASQTDLGELTWNLSLEPGQQATIRHRFTVEHPAQVTITGL